MLNYFKVMVEGFIVEKVYQEPALNINASVEVKNVWDLAALDEECQWRERREDDAAHLSNLDFSFLCLMIFWHFKAFM